MRKWLSAALLAALVGILCAPAGSAAPTPVIDQDPPDCAQIPPEEVPPVAASVDPTLPLEARVMVESADLATAKSYMAVTKSMFERIGIKLKIRFDVVSVPADWSQDVLGGSATPSRDEIFAFVKDHYHGERPPGVDVVYFMTRYWAGGFAECIGGVRFPDKAFAIGSVEYATEGVVPSPTADEGVIAGHEIGHLLGAHHHYANCAEAQPDAASMGNLNPCTTMWPLAAQASTTFGILERSFIRSYVAEYAKG